MIPMLRLQFIIFALIGIGFFVKKKGMVSREGQKNITDLVINVILPCNIVTSFVQELPDSALRECATIFLISVGAEVLYMLYSEFAYRNVEENKKKCLTYGTLVSNAGFLGNPVAEGVYGPMGLMLASVYLIPVRVIMWSKGIAIFSGELRKYLHCPCVDPEPFADSRKVQHSALHDGDRHDLVRHRSAAAIGPRGTALHSRPPAHSAGPSGSDPSCPAKMRAGLRAIPARICASRGNARPCYDEHACVKI